jgi:hypothetical protein
VASLAAQFAPGLADLSDPAESRGAHADGTRFRRRNRALTGRLRRD